MTQIAFMLAQADPAGGAAAKEVIGATAGALIATSLLFALGFGHRAGRTRLLDRWSRFASRVGHLPPWVALPSALGTASLITALLGMYWDISLHIDNGRDAGPLANPAHYLILFGLFGIFAAGFLAMTIPREKPCPTAIRLYDGWDVPLGGLLMAAAGGFALIGFPLDDMWHRLFGQDVTLWGPTHLMLIGGASISLIGQGVLLAEGTRAQGILRGENRSGRVPFYLMLRRAALGGGFLIGLSTFQAEFDFGVPQFDFLFQPMLIALAASIGLVSARLWGGRGGALAAVAFFIAVRGFVSLMVAGTWGESTPHFPLYLVEALLVEGAGLLLLTKRPLAFGAVAGVLIGTVGTAAEWGWSHVWMPLPWPSALLPEVFVVTVLAGLGGGLVGTFIGGALRGRPEPFPRGARVVFPLAGLLVAALIAFGLATSPQDGISARVQLQDVPGSPRAVNATVTLDPPTAAADAKWLTTTAWQGGGLVVDRLERVREGVYRTNEPIPVHGSWKAEFRLHSGRALLGVPVYLPDDPAILAKGVPASASFERPFVRDKDILQREAKDGAAGLTVLGYGIVLAITLSIIALNAWALVRLATVTEDATPSGDRFRRSPAAREPVPAA
jgi:hypothetical protein